MPNKFPNELAGILGLALVVIVSFVVAQVSSVSFILAFLIIAGTAWGGLHLREVQLRKEIASRAELVFDIQPEEVVLKREKFEPPLIALTKEKDGEVYEVEVVQRITTKDNIFVGFRKMGDGQEGVALESDLDFRGR